MHPSIQDKDLRAKSEELKRTSQDLASASIKLVLYAFGHSLKLWWFSIQTIAPKLGVFAKEAARL